jgi:hypothetical protein
MKKRGDKVKEYCEKCRDKQTFQVSEISEYGEVWGICDKCKNIMQL